MQGSAHRSLHPMHWVRAHDRDLAALRRAGRTALVMPAMFAIGDKVIGNPTIASFAAFGSFAMLLLVDFAGPLRDRLQAQAALALVGGLFVCLGTITSRETWLAAVSMTVVGWAVLFSGVVSSVLAGASTALLLAFILPVSEAGPISSIPDRLAGWGMASAAGLLAITLLWPAPSRGPLRQAAVGACRELASRLRSDAARLRGRDRPLAPEPGEEGDPPGAAVEGLKRVFLATPYRPTGLTTAARAVVRLVDELIWLNTVVDASKAYPGSRSEGDGSLDSEATEGACAVRLAVASVLERGADLLGVTGGEPDDLHTAQAELREALVAMEGRATAGLPIHQSAGGSPALGVQARVGELVTALDPSFRAQEMSFAVSQIAANVEVASAAERRSWLDRLVGRQPGDLAGPFSAAQERAASHIDRHSVWMHNSLRGAFGLGGAVLVADLTGVQHSFWVVLGALSVLRSNALNTGQNVIRGLVGTVAGFVVGAVLLSAIGTNTTLLWLLLPPAILVAGFAPTAISFAAGQAGFTVVLVILFNIVEPAGWRVGLIRVEDIALGCAVSLGMGILFWPRGAGAALGQALAEAYTDSAGYFARAVEFGMGCCDFSVASRPAPRGEALRAAAAARRLDDAFRSYLAERGAKPVPLAAVAALVTGVAGLRLASDAVLDLWDQEARQAGGDREASRHELHESSEVVAAWYVTLGASLNGGSSVPEPLAQDPLADDRLVEAVRHDLGDDNRHANGTAVRVIWTADHLDAARRLQNLLVGPAHTVIDQRRGSRRHSWARLAPTPLASSRQNIWRAPADGAGAVAQ